MRLRILVVCFLVACSSDDHDGDGGVEGGPDVQPDVIVDTANCVAPTTSNDSEGVGGYCSPGGGQCATAGPGGAPRICSADLAGAEPHEWYCTYPCTTSADCGSGAQCLATAQGMICVPPACGSPIDAGDEDVVVDASTDAITSDATDASTE